MNGRCCGRTPPVTDMVRPGAARRNPVLPKMRGKYLARRPVVPRKPPGSGSRLRALPVRVVGEREELLQQLGLVRRVAAQNLDGLAQLRHARLAPGGAVAAPQAVEARHHVE